MTKEQELAIKRMNKALKALKDADIKICGMDGNLLYATKDAIEKRDKSKDYGGYTDVAECNYQNSEDCGAFKADCYTDSGGW